MNKPEYSVPTMGEIKSIPWNGYKMASTFSGAGGTCLGFRMAGFRIIWASEFVREAREVYALNHPTTKLDARDIRNVPASVLLEELDLGVGELDILEGSPPCASFSTSGRRAQNWGKQSAYSETAQRTDDLFFVFSKLVGGIQPKVFVAENVSGLIKGVAKGYFLAILADLKSQGYRVKAKLLDASWLGVPQARQRLFFIGVREDLRIDPAFPSPLPYQYWVSDALPWITRLKLGGSPDNWKSAKRPAGTVTSSDGARESKTAYLSSYMIEAEADLSKYAVGREWLRTNVGGNSDRYLNLKRAPIDGPSQTVTAMGGSPGSASVTHPTEQRKWAIAELKRISGFPDDFELRGGYAQQWERIGRAVPPVMASHIAATIRDNILGRIA